MAVLKLLVPERTKIMDSMTFPAHEGKRQMGQTVQKL
jgi:hypothetical protein